MTRAWSHKDPIVHIDGRDLNISVEAYSDASIGSDFSLFDTGPIDLDIHYPAGHSHSYTIPPDQADGYGAGWNIHFTTDSSMNSGTKTDGTPWCQVGCIANIPADVDPATGLRWRLRITLTPSSANSADTQGFRSSTPSLMCGPVRV